MNKKNRSAQLVTLGSALLIFATEGCSPPPSTSPAVSITSPVAMATLPAGQPIDVRFTISGIDESEGTMTSFMLASGGTKVVGRGRVRAFVDQSNFVAQTTLVPNDANPFMIPDPTQVSDPSIYLRPGFHTIRLQLYYNDDPRNTKVDPQREGVVTIKLE